MDKPIARVLLVDDEPMVLSSYRLMLRELGADIRATDDPIEALRLLDEEPADVIVADYQMPTMRGDAFLEQVRERWPTTTRILVTASTDIAMMEEVVRRGEVFRFLTKPCHTKKFCGAVRDGLAEHERIERDQQQNRKYQLDLQSYRHLFESAADSMMFADLDGTIVEVNEAFVRSNGDDRDCALTQRPTLLSGLQNDGLSWQRVKEDLDRDGHWTGEVTRPNYNALLTLSRINDDKGAAYAYAAVEKDISATRRLEQQSRAAQYEVILALAKLAEYRDPETGAHLERMRRFSQVLTAQLKGHARFPHINDTYIEAIFYSSPLHDVGKVGIPDSILLKPGKLTAEEWTAMKTHTLIGADVLMAAGETLAAKTWLSLARTIALQHHEKFDGSGYPKGIKGTDIDPAARIVALADVYDAITSKRVYKAAVPHDEAKERILEASGSHLDPDVVQAFIDAEETFVEIRQRFDDEALDIRNHLTLLRPVS